MKIYFADSDIEKFIYSLEESTISKVFRTIDFLKRFGNTLGLPHSKKVAEQLFELRVRGNQEVRLFYSFEGKDKAILLHGFIKKSQRIPKKELKMALVKLHSFDIK